MWHLAAQQASNVGNGNDATAGEESDGGSQVESCGPYGEPAGLLQTCRVVDGNGIGRHGKNGDAAQKCETSNAHSSAIDHVHCPGLLAKVLVVGIDFEIRCCDLILERGGFLERTVLHG